MASTGSTQRLSKCRIVSGRTSTSSSTKCSKVFDHSVRIQSASRVQVVDFIDAKIGRPHLSTDAHPIDSTYDDDFIHFSKVLHSGLFQEARQFYESGLSLEQVAGRLKKSKDFIRSTMIAGGVSLRPSIHTPDRKAARNQGRMAGAAPYGFTYLRGQLVVHPDEVENLLFILDLWHQGQGARWHWKANKFFDSPNSCIEFTI